ncbi:MAG: glutamyl-tRNA amidotransferase, partial [Chloroflexi bacterium]|nr:glutamyl-tRNA amidotransferase [Chloroflexota bacterium]
IWSLSASALVAVLQQEPPGLCLGRVELQGGELVFGVLAEPYLISGQQEITRWGGWREYRQSQP